MINKDHSKLSIVKQSTLLQVHRSGLYYTPKGESDLNLELMRLIDKQLNNYFEYYNVERRHQGIHNEIPFKRDFIMRS